MKDYLSIKIESDTDGTCELIAAVQANGFSGRSSAWFNLSEISVFASSLAQFPLPASARITLRGGYWGNSAPAAIEQEHVGIEVYPIGGTGVIGVRVNLATSVQESDRSNEFFKVVVELKTSYTELGRFAGALASLVSGRGSEALLRAEEV